MFLKEKLEIINYKCILKKAFITNLFLSSCEASLATDLSGQGAFPRPAGGQLPAPANCQPHHRCWFIPLIIHKVACSLLCRPDASLFCQSMSAAHCTGHVTDAEKRHKYFRKYRAETGSQTGCTCESTAVFQWPSSLFSKGGRESLCHPRRKAEYLPVPLIAAL